MFSLFSDLSIRKKLSFSITFILLLISLFLFTYYPYQEEQYALKTLENKVMSMAEMVSLGVGIGLASDDFLAVSEALEWAKRDRNLSYIILIDTSGEIFASFNPGQRKVDVDDHFEKGHIFETDDHLRAVVPIEFGQDQYGKLFLGYSLSYVHARVRETRVFTLYVCLAIFLVGQVLMFLFSRFIVRPLKELHGAAKRVSEGQTDVKVKVETRDELGVLSVAFNEMIESIIHSRHAIQQQNWLKSGLAELAKSTNSDQEIDELSAHILEFLVSYLGCSVGAIFLVEEKEKLRLVSKYIGSAQTDSTCYFNFGEGLVGQAALSRKKIVISGIDERGVRIKSAFLDTKPRHVMAVPFLFEKTLKGVLELGTFDKFTEIQEEFLEQTLMYIGIVINSARSRTRTQRLLQASRKQARELKQQQTELKRTHEELERQHDLLEKRNEDLRMAQKQIEEKAEEIAQANSYKSDFLANMSHEIRTPLNAVVGMTDLALDTDLTEEQKEYLQVVQTSSESLLAIINDILDFSKIEAGQMEIEQTNFKLSEVVETIAEMLSIRAQKKEIELTCYHDPALPDWFVGDPTKLRQILVNLTNNAIKFTGAGEIAITVEPAELNGDKRTIDQVTLHFSVSDTGTGIDKKNLNRIFEKFSQEDSSTTRRYGGTGLGLSISKSLLEMMGGRIWVESEVGKGTTFHFELSLEQGKDESHELETYSYPDLENMTVLIIDDNKTNRTILEKTLTAKGVEWFSASSGKDGLSLLRQKQNEIDVVLLDHQMPEMDGVEVATKVRQNPDWDDVEIIMLSSWGGISASEVEELQISKSIAKPVKQSQLFDVLLHTLKSPRCHQDEDRFDSLIEGTDAAHHKILVVDDNIDNLRVGSKMLNKHGLKVETADNGKQAVEMFEKVGYDLILMDIQMPTMDGFEATRNIRQMEQERQWSRIPIVAVTAHAMPEYHEQCLQNGMDDYVTKPFKTGTLLQKVGQWLDFRPKILLVDDNADNRKLLLLHLEKTGKYSLITAANGREAIQQFERFSFALILMDMEMPVMNGYEATREIRKQDEGEELPIVALTAHQGVQDKQKCLKAGCTGFLSKPIRKEQLLDMVEVHLPDLKVVDENKIQRNAKSVVVNEVESTLT